MLRIIRLRERLLVLMAFPIMLMEDGTVRVFGENGEDLPIIPLHPDITDPVALYGNYSYVAVLDASGIARMIYNEGIHVIKQTDCTRSTYAPPRFVVPAPFIPTARSLLPT